jgi:hypothetical protein
MASDNDPILVRVNEFIIEQDAPNSMEELALTMRKHIVVFLSLDKSAYEALN